MKNNLSPTNGFIFVRSPKQKQEVRNGFIVPTAVDNAQPIIEGEIVTFDNYDSITVTDSYDVIHKLYNGARILYPNGRGTHFNYKGENLICLDIKLIRGIVNYG